MNRDTILEKYKIWMTLFFLFLYCQISVDALSCGGPLCFCIYTSVVLNVQVDDEFQELQYAQEGHQDYQKVAR